MITNSSVNNAIPEEEFKSFLCPDIKIPKRECRKIKEALKPKEEYVSDLRTQKSLDRHIGHTRRIAENFYELQPKEIDANVTSHAIDQLQNLPSNYKFKMCEIGTGSQVLQLVSLEEEIDDVSAEVTENAECGDTSSGESDEDDGDDYEQKNGELLKVRKRPRSLPFTHQVSTKKKEMPTIDLISKFLCNRPRKKLLTDQQNFVLAKFFYSQLRGKSVPNKTSVHHLVEEADANNKTSYNHICFLLKDLQKWKQAGFRSYGF